MASWEANPYVDESRNEALAAEAQHQEQAIEAARRLAVEHLAQEQSGATALIVENQSYARRNGRAALEGLGYSVVALEAGDEALKLLPALSRRLSCAVLDLSISDVDWTDLFCQLRVAQPTLPVLLACGDATIDSLCKIALDAYTLPLAKPYHIRTIQAQLAILLPGTAPAIVA